MSDSEFEARVLIFLKWEIFRFGKKKIFDEFYFSQSKGVWCGFDIWLLLFETESQ